MGDPIDLIVSALTGGLSENVGRPGFIRGKPGRRLTARQEAEEIRRGPRPGDVDRRRRRRRGRRGGRGATVLSSGQELGVANVALKRLTGV